MAQRSKEEIEIERRRRVVIRGVGFGMIKYALMIIALIGLVVAGAIGLLYSAGVV